MVNMEIKTMFEIIIGVIMMITITVAVVALMGGLMSMTVSECNPAEYIASTVPLNQGNYCGMIGANKAYCEKTPPAMFATTKFDDCIDSSKNVCCPTETKKNVVFRSGKCCNITKV